VGLTLHCATIGLEESLLEVFELYPNPNNGSFTIEIPEAWIGKQALIYDMQGRLLTKLDLTAKKSQIEMNNFARGAYWLQIDNEVPVKWMKN